MTDILWIADRDAEFLIGADGYDYECKDDQGRDIILFNVSDQQLLYRTPGAVVRLLVVQDSDGKLWGTKWASLVTGTPGFTWNEALTKRRDHGDETKWQMYQWVGFLPVQAEVIQTTDYAFVEETS